jgi:hypothetical protein
VRNEVNNGKPDIEIDEWITEMLGGFELRQICDRQVQPDPAASDLFHTDNGRDIS